MYSALPLRRDCERGCITVVLISLDFASQQATGFFIARRAISILTGCDSRERNNLPVAECGTRQRKFIADGPEIFFRVQRTIFARGMTQEKLEYWLFGIAQFQIPVSHSAGAILITVSNCSIHFG